MKKLFLGRLLSVVMVLAMVMTMVACGDTTKNPDSMEDLAGTYKVTVWVSEVEGVKELFQSQIDAFEAANPGIIIDAKVEGVSEGDAATTMITSVEDGADIFCFAQDQLSRLVMAGALNPLGDATAQKVAEMNDSSSVAAASVGGKVYCYPITADNGYFMFYDKSVIKAEHIDSLEDILADCVAAGRNFSYDLEGSAWYTAGFFFATGCKSEWISDVNGNFTGIEDDFNSDKGIIALKGMQKVVTSGAYNSSSSHSDFSAAIPSAVVISGTWGAATAKEILGENYGVADLPSFTVDGQSYHLGSYSGNKLMGVKPQKDVRRAAVLQQLALYLSGEECQLERFDELGWGPSNKAAQENDSVKSDSALAALREQNEYATPQGQINGAWWDIAKVVATGAKRARSEAELKKVLDDYDAAIAAVLSSPKEVVMG